MENPLNQLEDVGEAITLASQADQAARADDEELIKFEELFRELNLLQQLQLEGKVRSRYPAQLKELNSLKDPQEVVDKILAVTLKSEESSQLHVLTQKAIDVGQLSMILESAPADQERVKLEEEIAKTSIEFMNIATENLELVHQLQRMNFELKLKQDNIRSLEKDIAQLKANPEAGSGAQSERIEKLESQLDKSCGRYDFTRFLIQLLLMASEEDLNHAKINHLFVKCGEAAYD